MSVVAILQRELGGDAMNERKLVANWGPGRTM